MGIGIAEGEGRAKRAAQEAIICPLLEQTNIHGATGVVVNIKGGADITMREIQDAVEIVQKSAHADANIIFGAVVDDVPHDEIQVTVIAAGFKKGVSNEFLEEPVESPLSAMAASRSAPRPSQPAAKSPEPVKAAEPAASKPPGETELLFPEEREESRPKPSNEPDEDMSIPAFMRRRKREQ